MVAAVLAGHSIAGADNYGYVSGYPNRFPDDTSSHYCFRDVAAQADRDRINFAEGVLDSQTVMYDQYVTTCGVSTDAAWEFTDWCDTPFPRVAHSVTPLVSTTLSGESAIGLASILIHTSTTSLPWKRDSTDRISTYPYVTSLVTPRDCGI